MVITPVHLNHPLGEYVISQACNLKTPTAKVFFDYQLHDAKVTIAEQLLGQSGWLTLSLLTIESLQTEQYLVFTGLKDDGSVLDTDTCQKLFNLPGSSEYIEVSAPENLQAQNERQVQATLSRSLEANTNFLKEEREKLEKWADDKVLAVEQALQDTKVKIRSLSKKSRQANSIEEQQEAQKKLRELECQKRRQRQEIFDVEDEITEKRDELIEQLEKRLKQKTILKTLLFTVQWKVI